MPHTWDPGRYLRFADERGRPFADLLARVDPRHELTAPRVVDLGCGPGNLTAGLPLRWPGADILGLDSSAEMIERARTDAGGVRYEVADLRTWLEGTSGEVDVLLANAVLQWLPEHLELAPALVHAVRPGGWLAFQVPGNFEEPSHALRRDLAAEEPYAEHLRGVAVPASHDPAAYLRALRAAGCDVDRVDAWETTYTHVLAGEDPVFAWVSGTGARPTLQALPDELRPDFEEEFRRRLRAAYPPEPDGTVLLPFRRIFVVARVGEGER